MAKILPMRPQTLSFFLCTLLTSVVVNAAFYGSCNSRGLGIPKRVSSQLHASGKPKLTPAQRALQDTMPKEDNINDFDKLKNIVYEGVDTLQSLGKGKSKTDKVMGGYSEREVQALKGVQPPPLSPETKKSEKKKKVSPLDAIKSAVYGTIDAADQVVSGKESSVGPKPVDSLPVASRADSPSSILSPTVLARLAPDLNSDNPFVRIQAEFKLKKLEADEQVRIQKREFEDKVRETKEFVYSIGDGIKASADFVATIPGEAKKIAESTTEFVTSVPQKVDDAVETVQSIPGKVKQTADDIQETVDNTVNATKTFVADVQDIPNKVQRKAEETKQGIENAKNTANEVATNAKVLLGLEKPKPRPPKTPPPTPPKAQDIVLNLLGGILTTFGKLAWWIGKEGTSAAFGAVKSGLATEKSKKNTKTSPPVKSKAKTPKPPTKPKVTPKVPDPETSKEESKTRKNKELYESSLDREVRDALELAAEALEAVEQYKADEEDEKEKKEKKN